MLPFLTLLVLGSALSTVTARQSERDPSPPRREALVWLGSGLGNASGHGGGSGMALSGELGAAFSGFHVSLFGGATADRMLFPREGDRSSSFSGLLIGRSVSTRWLSASAAAGLGRWESRTFRVTECNWFCRGTWDRTDSGLKPAYKAEVFLKLAIIGVGLQLWGTLAEDGGPNVGPMIVIGKLW